MNKISVAPNSRAVAAIVLAAGSSQRMGSDNKLLLEVNGRALVRASVQQATDSNVQGSFVVLGHEADEVAAALQGLDFQPVINQDWPLGMSSSLRAGVEAAQRFDAVAILLADMPWIDSRVINALLSVFLRQETPSIVVAVRDGRRGHPVIWPAQCFPDLMALNGDVGGKQLLTHFAHMVIEVDIDTDAIFLDMDTPEDFARANSPDAMSG